MKDYIGVKVVTAEPVSRGEYMNTEDGRYQVTRIQKMKAII